MKRILLCLVLLAQTGCMSMDRYGWEEIFYHDYPAESCGCATGQAHPAHPAGIPVPRVAPTGPGVVPAGGIPMPPPPPQTREPDLIGR